MAPKATNIFEKQFLDDIRAKARGVEITQLSLQSVVKEMGLLQMIEVNHPSKLVKAKIPIQMQNPANKDNMIDMEVDYEYRVMMSEEEAIEHAKENTLKMAQELLEKNPELMSQFIEKVTAKSKSKRSKKGGK